MHAKQSLFVQSAGDLIFGVAPVGSIFNAMASYLYRPDVLLAIPDAVTKRVLTEWLSLLDVVRVDNAYINHTGRRQLLKVMSHKAGSSAAYKNCNMVLPSDWEGPYTRSVHFFAWLVQRKIRVPVADIPFSLVGLKAVTISFLELQAPRLECIKFTGTDYAPSTTLRFLTALAESCRELQDITLSGGFEIDSVFMSHLSSNCPKLRRLAFSGFSIYSNIDPTHCSGLKFQALNSLEVDNATVTDETLQVLLQGSPHLEDIRLCDAYQLTEVTFKSIATYAGNLKCLELVNIEVSDALLMPIVTANPGLTRFVLEVADAADISDALIIAIANKCKLLCHIEINNAWALTDASLEAIAERCAELTVCNLRNNANYTNASIQLIATYCKQLKHVELFDLTEVSADAKGYFKEGVEVKYHKGTFPFWM